MRRIAVIIGHKSTEQGADGLRPIGKSEWIFNKDFVFPLMEKFAKRRNEVEIKLFDKSGSTYAQTGKLVDMWISGADKGCAIELHFNSAGVGAYGTETLVELDDPKTFAFADLIQRGMCGVFSRGPGNGDRGVKKLKSGERGHYPLSCVKSPIVIVEPTFAGSNPVEATFLWSRKEAYAKCLVDAACDFLNQVKGG